MKLRNKLICILLVIVLAVACISIPVVSQAEESYAVTILKNLGLYSATEEDATISYFDCGLLILMTKNLQGEVLQVTDGTYYTHVFQLSQAQANQVRNYFSSHKEYGMQSYLGGSAVLVPPVSAPSQMIETKVPSYVVYQALLTGLGYTPGQDFTTTKAGILEFAAKAGFQAESILDVEATTYEDVAEILCEAIFLNTKDGVVLLKKMSAENSVLAEAVEKNGIFAEVSNALPAFTAGIVISGSEQTGGTDYVEYQVQYGAVTEGELDAYVTELQSAGWSLQTAFTEEITSEDSYKVFYTLQRMIQGELYFAVLTLDVNAGIFTLWYAY